MNRPNPWTHAEIPVISEATVWNAPKHEIRAIVRGSFCARHNHRDFLAISWNIWAICLRDERRPAGCLTARFTLSFLFLFLPLLAAGYTRRLHDHRRVRFLYRINGENREYFRNEWILDVRNVNYRYSSWFAPAFCLVIISSRFGFILLSYSGEKILEMCSHNFRWNRVNNDLSGSLFLLEISCEQLVSLDKSTARDLMILKSMTINFLSLLKNII